MKVLASWDDGSKFDLKMAELMNKYGIQTIFYWPGLLNLAKNVDSPMTDKDYKEIAGQFEIGSHGMSHQPMKKMSIATVGMEIHESKKKLQDLTGQSIDSFAYPKNSFSSLTKALIKGADYKSARTSIPGWLSPGEDPFVTQCTVQIGIDRIEYGEKSWELFAEEMLEKVDDSSVYHIFGNSWDVEVNNDWDALENLLKKITS